MTSEEQQLISGVFDRLKAAEAGAKDFDAERLIRDRISGMPDAPYRLVQSVILQQQAMQALDDRLQYAENLIADLQPASRNGGGSFLPGRTGASDQVSSSVPRIGQGQPQATERASEATPSRAGGFLASALTTASGVAGGMLLTDGIRELFGGHRAGGGSDAGASRSDLSTLDRYQDEAQDARNDADEAKRQLAADDAALDDAQDALDSPDTSAWDSDEA